MEGCESEGAVEDPNVASDAVPLTWGGRMAKANLNKAPVISWAPRFELSHCMYGLLSSLLVSLSRGAVPRPLTLESAVPFVARSASEIHNHVILADVLFPRMECASVAIFMFRNKCSIEFSLTWVTIILLVSRRNIGDIIHGCIPTGLRHIKLTRRICAYDSQLSFQPTIVSVKSQQAARKLRQSMNISTRPQ